MKPNCNSCSRDNAAEEIAAQFGVSVRTVYNDAKFYEAAEELGIVDEILTGRNKLTRKRIIEMARAKREGRQLDFTERRQPTPLESVQKAVARLSDDDADRLMAWMIDRGKR